MRNQNPFEDFIYKHVEFDNKGRSKLTSSHGLAKLLRFFYREVVKEEKKDLIEKIERMKLMDMEHTESCHRKIAYQVPYTDRTKGYNNALNDVIQLLKSKI